MAIVIRLEDHHDADLLHDLLVGEPVIDTIRRARLLKDLGAALEAGLVEPSGFGPGYPAVVEQADPRARELDAIERSAAVRRRDLGRPA